MQSFNCCWIQVIQVEQRHLWEHGSHRMDLLNEALTSCLAGKVTKSIFWERRVKNCEMSKRDMAPHILLKGRKCKSQTQSIIERHVVGDSVQDFVWKSLKWWHSMRYRGERKMARYCLEVSLNPRGSITKYADMWSGSRLHCVCSLMSRTYRL